MKAAPPAARAAEVQITADVLELALAVGPRSEEERRQRGGRRVRNAGSPPARKVIWVAAAPQSGEPAPVTPLASLHSQAAHP